jgi:NAD+ diphosphatase
MDKSDYKKMNELVEGKQGEDGAKQADSSASAPTNGQEKQDKAVADEEPPFRLPPDSAIAGVLIRDWADGKIGFFDQKAPPRNNL